MENDTIQPLKRPSLMQKGTCLFCGDPTPHMVCPDCETKNEATNEALRENQAKRLSAERAKSFREQVGNYGDTDITRMPDTAATRAASSYIVGSGAGLTIVGPGDTGKTRSAVWIACKEVAAGCWVEFRQCGELRQAVVQHAKQGEWGKGVSPLMRCGILILDDFGNHEFTRTAEEFFLALLERRTNHGLRTFVTTQYTTDQLRKLFTTEQMADAILRRLGKGFATIVNTAENLILPWK